MDSKRTILIRAAGLELKAEVLPNETGDKILSILPIVSHAQRWGEEIYFSIPLSLPRAADAREVVAAGELGYWPDGTSFCIFFGRTPVSRGDEIRAASPVNVFGRIVADWGQLTAVGDGQEISVDRV